MIFVRPRIRRWVTTAFLVGMILGALAVFAVRFGLAFGQDDQLAVVASPNGKYEAVVYADPGGVIDPVWRATIRERDAVRPSRWVAVTRGRAWRRSGSSSRR